MPLPIPVISILMLLMIAPCIISCLNCCASGQINKLQHAVPVQQANIKPQPTTENTTHPWTDSTMRARRLETSKRGRPNAPRRPSAAGSSQRGLDAPISKELGLLTLEGVMLGS